MLERIGYVPEMAGWAAAADASLGRVVRVDRGVAGVLTDTGPARASFGADVLAGIAADPMAAPCPGDWCVVREWPDRRTTLEVILPRRSAVVRAAAGEHSHGQVLCANVDFAVVVMSLHPVPMLAGPEWLVPVLAGPEWLEGLEGLLALDRESGAQPLVVLSKADLVGDAAQAAQVAEDVAVLARGVEVVCTSTITGVGLPRLRELLDGRRTLALLGSPGHGKSSLTDALSGTGTPAVRQLREEGRGRHTSVRRELVVLPGGGAVIDTPGPRRERLRRRKTAGREAGRTR